jgi:hypothetical protein
LFITGIDIQNEKEERRRSEMKIYSKLREKEVNVSNSAAGDSPAAGMVKISHLLRSIICHLKPSESGKMVKGLLVDLLALSLVIQ